MRKFIAALVLAAVVMSQAVNAQSPADLQKEIQELKQQLAVMEEVKSRLDALEKKLDESQKAQEASKPSVTTALADSQLKIDGRLFAGIIDTGNDGSTPNWSTDINDAKLRFTFTPSSNITIVNRLSTTGAKNGDFDYFYLDYRGVLSPTSTVRIGQRKIDVGQESWVDNPVENMLITNSPSRVSGYGTGLAFLGKFTDSPDSGLYEIGFVNGPRGVMTRTSTGLQVNAKVGTPVADNVFASASYFDTGKLGAADKSAVSVAELSDAPSGATNWERKLWELDLRYNYGNSGIRSLIPTGEIPPVMLGATYGSFNDSASGAAGRRGDYWFAEGLIKLSSRLYGAARYGVVNLSNGASSKLVKSPVSVNSYRRTSIGLGYSLTDLTQLKLEYAFNSTSGGASEPSLNQAAFGVATKF